MSNRQHVHQSDGLSYDDANTNTTGQSSSAIGNDIQQKPNNTSGNPPRDTFACSHCTKSFNRRENLSRHLKTHDSSPSHICQKCNKGFTRSDLLKRHEAGHERWDNQAPKDRSSGGSKRRKVGLEEAGSASSPSSSSTGTGTGNPAWLPHTARGRPSSEPSHMHQNVQGAYPHNGVPPVVHQVPLVDRTVQQDEYHASQYQNYQPMMNSMPGQDAAYTHPSATNEYIQNFQTMQSMEIPFDFSSFLLPADPGPIASEWFTYDFYSAMRETGNDGGSLEDIMLTSSQDYGSLPDSSHDDVPMTQQEPVNTGFSPINAPEEPPRGRQEEELAAPRDAREESPPNEASEEDKWPFQWNPRSRPVLRAQAITIPPDHPLVTDHDPRFDITEITLLRLKAFLTPPAAHADDQSQSSFILPPLHILNIFIRLFFKHFSPQMPVLHHPTVNTNTDLPPPLIGAMVIIGAIYSHIKHTRRFAIVLLDIVRWHLQIALECDNSLMRDPMIIYAEGLICHTGLWCGNKRAFELAEVIRGAMVTYIRRVKFGEPLPQYSSRPSPSLGTGNLQADWKSWVEEESLRRLSWVCYAIDSQFPCLLNMTSSISIGEVRNLGCPCDEEFWFASSARNWKNLLGPATVPPSRSFSAAVGPFILVTSLPTTESGAKEAWREQRRLPCLNLNPWSAFLVLMAIQNQIFEFNQEHLIVRTFTDDEDPEERERDDPVIALKTLHSIHRSQLAKSLSNWAKSYQTLPPRANTHASSRHFHASSLVIHHLSTIFLDISLTDIQSTIGKDGDLGQILGFRYLSVWAKKAREKGGDNGVVKGVICNAIRAIVGLAPTGKAENYEDWCRNTDMAPYSLITLFLCHIVLWVFADVGSDAQKKEILQDVSGLAQGEGGGNSEVAGQFLSVVAHGWGIGGGLSGVVGGIGEGEGEGDKTVLFRSAAEMLTRLGTWGASLNLALLLMKRAEMDRGGVKGK